MILSHLQCEVIDALELLSRPSSFTGATAAEIAEAIRFSYRNRGMAGVAPTNDEVRRSARKLTEPIANRGAGSAANRAALLIDDSAARPARFRLTSAGHVVAGWRREEREEAEARRARQAAATVAPT